MVTPLYIHIQFLANWYEERLAKEQVYRAKPDLRMVNTLSLAIRYNSNPIASKFLFIDERERD